MAEYDNLLAEALDLGPATQQEDRLLIQKLAEMGRALQTENTELQGRVKTLLNEQVAGIGFMNRAHAAERVITEVQEWREWADKEYGVWQVKPGASSRTGMRLTEKLSSYPLGEGQTQEAGSR